MLDISAFSVIATLILPAIILVILPVSSMTAGVLVCACGWILISLAGGRNPYSFRRQDLWMLISGVFITILIVMHLLFSASLGTGASLGRGIGSSALFLLFWISAYFTATVLGRLRLSQLALASDVMLAGMILVAIAAVAGVPAIGAHTSGKPVVIFSEPSHFALAYLPVFLFRTSTSSRLSQIVLIFITLLLALALQSLILAAAALFAAGLTLRRGWLFAIVLLLMPLIAVINLSYFTDRLDFSPDSTNVSTLVLLAGWQNAYSDFMATHGLGVGFQQLGVAGDAGQLSDRIAAILGGEYINLRDGGSTAAKLIGEFGVIGIAILIAYMRRVMRAISFIRQSQLISYSKRDIGLLFLYSMIVSYCFELFLRGLGYFSAGGLLAVASLIALRRRLRLRRAKPVRTDDVPPAWGDNPAAGDLL